MDEVTELHVKLAALKSAARWRTAFLVLLSFVLGALFGAGMASGDDVQASTGVCPPCD